MPGPVYALLDVVVDPSKSITVLEPFDSFLEIENSCEIKWWIVKDSIVELELLRKSTMA